MIEQNILELLEKARNLAHAPYSNFKVGAVIIDDQGQQHMGCNIENAAFPSGCCAEQSAVSNMVVNGGRNIQRIYIKGSDASPCPPCGNCRQIISELGTPETQIFMIGTGTQQTVCTLKELLPSQFSPSQLDSGKS